MWGHNNYRIWKGPSCSHLFSLMLRTQVLPAAVLGTLWILQRRCVAQGFVFNNDATERKRVKQTGWVSCWQWRHLQSPVAFLSIFPLLYPDIRRMWYNSNVLGGFLTSHSSVIKWGLVLGVGAVVGCRTSLALTLSSSFSFLNSFHVWPLLTLQL